MFYSASEDPCRTSDFHVLLYILYMHELHDVHATDKFVLHLNHYDESIKIERKMAVCCESTLQEVTRDFEDPPHVEMLQLV